MIAPVFGVMVLGFVAARLGWFDERATGGLVRFVFFFAIPALLFRSMATVETAYGPEASLPVFLLIALPGATGRRVELAPLRDPDAIGG